MEYASKRHAGEPAGVRAMVNRSASRLADQMRDHAGELDRARRISDPTRRAAELRRLDVRTIDLRIRSAETQQVALSLGMLG